MQLLIVKGMRGTLGLILQQLPLTTIFKNYSTLSNLGLDIKTAYRHHTFGTFLQGSLGIALVLLGHRISQTAFA